MRSIFLLAILFSALTALAAPGAPVYDIPRMQAVVIDGKDGDWQGKGFRVEMMKPIWGETQKRSADDHDAQFQLGWDEEGLLILARVTDDRWLEHPKKGMMWRQDAMEVFLAPHRGSSNICQWVISPGMSKAQHKLRFGFHDLRKDESLRVLPAGGAFRRTRKGNSVIIEGRLPWSSLAIKPGEGREVAVQVFFGESDEGDSRQTAIGWYPDSGIGGMSDSKLAYTVRLAARSHGPLATYVTSHRFNAAQKQYEVSVTAQRERVGNKVVLEKDGMLLAAAELEPGDDGRARGLIKLALPAEDMNLDALTVSIENTPNDSVDLLDANTARLLAAHAEGPPEVIDIGSRLELFVDHALIDRLAGAELRLHHPVAREKVMTYGDKPCEGRGSGYVTVFRDGDRCRMYYRGASYDTKGEAIRENICYAESKDGITWDRPDLGLFACNGSKQNNIVWQGVGSHNMSPFKDTNPACRRGEEYKAVGNTDYDAGLSAFKSSDGIHWSMLQEEPVIDRGTFDSHNVAFWDSHRNEYVCFSRIMLEKRTIQRCVSKDFIHWTRPELIRYGKDTPEEEMYTNGVEPYPRAPHILLGFPNRFMPSRKRVTDHVSDGVSGGLFMSSRDGFHWQRWAEDFIRPGLHRARWVDRVNMQALGMLFGKTGMTDSIDEITMYAMESSKSKDVGLRRYTLRVDGFVSAYARMAGGEMITKPLVFAGKELVMNFATSTAGSIRVEIQNADGAALDGYALESCSPIYGDAIEEVVAWEKGADVEGLAGKAVRLRFELKDADLYSIRFR
jgi:hypothetical protein